LLDPQCDLYAFRSGSMEREELDIKQVNTPLHVYIDGPFGAPTSQIFHAQHALLIGTGIGVTPFASILQSIMHRSVLCTFLLFFVMQDFFVSVLS
jgi:predicted ferric reductase